MAFVVVLRVSLPLSALRFCCGSVRFLLRGDRSDARHSDRQRSSVGPSSAPRCRSAPGHGSSPTRTSSASYPGGPSPPPALASSIPHRLVGGGCSPLQRWRRRRNRRAGQQEKPVFGKQHARSVTRGGFTATRPGLGTCLRGLEPAKQSRFATTSADELRRRWKAQDGFVGRRNEIAVVRRCVARARRTGGQPRLWVFVIFLALRFSAPGARPSQRRPQG